MDRHETARISTTMNPDDASVPNPPAAVTADPANSLSYPDDPLSPDNPMTRITALALAVSTVLPAAVTYQKPPKEVLDVLNAPLPPSLWVNPMGSHVLLGTLFRYPPISDVAQPFVGLAGVRVNPNTGIPRVLTYYTSLKVKDLATGKETEVALPAGARLTTPEWSPDGAHFAITNMTSAGQELYVGETATGKLRRIQGVLVNSVLGESMNFMNSKALLAKMVLPTRGPAPKAPEVPSGPVIQEASGQSGPVRTKQDMLDSAYDEALFEHFGTSQLVVVELASGKVERIGEPGMYTGMSASPDGQQFLIARIRKPYSYLYAYPAFPRDIEVWNRTGKKLYQVASLPLADKVPIEGVPTGPRSVRWFATEPATLVWTEALDGGNPKTKVPHRDRIVRFRAPFQGEPVEIARAEHRIMGWMPIEGTTRAFVTEFDRDRRWVRTLEIDAAQPGKEPRVIFSRNIADRYATPGTPVTELLPSSHRAIKQENGSIFFEGPGASPQGDRPTLERMKLDTLEREKLFQAKPNEYEMFIDFVTPDGSKFITRHESPTAAPNYFLNTIGGERKQITNYEDPTPQLRKIKKQLVRYKRPDGVELSFTLYLPPDYKEGTRLPTVVYAYPLEFTDGGTAGQVVGSPNRFTTLGGFSHLFYVLAGYAVLDNASMPVVGDPETVNNTYIEQITASAKAAIDKAAEMGVTDPNRVGVIGHSYGAFMTANLLAHTDFFKAGVARSGAYNRTLTPFGFQSERRTYWEAPETYMRMSPFQYAHKIKEPILFIHGQADNNDGTFPIQSERMFQAVRGNGGTARLVFLPHESHGYQGRESIEHTLWEMITWFDRFVKNAEPAGTVSGGGSGAAQE
jgi:dipeptidyl aminopeptidase/acylaminoacyl peptidase